MGILSVCSQNSNDDRQQQEVRYLQRQQKISYIVVKIHVTKVSYIVVKIYLQNLSFTDGSTLKAQDEDMTTNIVDTIFQFFQNLPAFTIGLQGDICYILLIIY